MRGSIDHVVATYARSAIVLAAGEHGELRACGAPSCGRSSDPTVLNSGGVGAVRKQSAFCPSLPTRRDAQLTS